MTNPRPPSTQFLDNRFWASKYDVRSPTEFANGIWNDLKRIQSFAATEGALEFLQGFYQANYSGFIDDIQTMEGGIEISSRKLEIKKRNLTDIVTIEFGTVYPPKPTKPHQITFKHACEIHKIIMKDLLHDSDLGIIRSRISGPAQTSHLYLHPDFIAEKIETVFQQAQRIDLESDVTEPGQILELVFAAATFFRNFLDDVHPFKNGNGRVARVLLCHLLNKICHVPLRLHFLHTIEESRHAYLQCLQESHCYSPPFVAPIATFILQAVYHNVSSICSLLNLYDSTDEL
jgi:fido (protein-threonine AMPylation protein)